MSAILAPLALTDDQVQTLVTRRFGSFAKLAAHGDEFCIQVGQVTAVTSRTAWGAYVAAAMRFGKAELTEARILSVGGAL